MRSLTFWPCSQGYAISGERTLQAFYQRLRPFATAFLALFGRERLPARSTLARFLAALPPEPVEALRSLFFSDLLARPLGPEEQPAGLWDRTESQWFVFALDGTREAARVSRLSSNTRPSCSGAPPPSAVCSWLHWAAAEGRSFALGPPFYKLLATSGSAHSVDRAMASHVSNYAERWPGSSSILRPIRSPQHA
jgi:hypothetical protein